MLTVTREFFGSWQYRPEIRSHEAWIGRFVAKRGWWSSPFEPAPWNGDRLSSLTVPWSAAFGMTRPFGVDPQRFSAPAQVMPRRT
jgi:hypothetical protein